METIDKKTRSKAFTIVELLTVMSIIVILISLLVPSLNMAKRYAKSVRQRAQFHTIGMALDSFSSDWDGYPNSNRFDVAGTPVAYCGAMKLAEAMMGQDLLGFHPASQFRSDGLDKDSGIQLYPVAPSPITAAYAENLKSRKGPYLPLENANAYKLKYLYGAGNTGALYQERFVLCDVYGNVTLKPDSTEAKKVSGKAGMPILYYKANVAGIVHPVKISGVLDNGVALPTTDDPNSMCFYNHWNNEDLVALGMPWAPTMAHPMAAGGSDLRGITATPYNFYNRIWDSKIYNATTLIYRPYRSDSYILMSAGFDGEYGTADDIFNFEPQANR